MDRIDIDPVRKEDGTLYRNSLGEGALDHLLRDAGDTSKRAGEEPFEAKGEVVNKPFRGQQPEIKGCINLEVLYMQPRGGSRSLSDQKRERRSEKSWLNREDNLGLPKSLTEHDRQASKHEGKQVHHAFET